MTAAAAVMSKWLVESAGRDVQRRDRPRQQPVVVDPQARGVDDAAASLHVNETSVGWKAMNVNECECIR